MTLALAYNLNFILYFHLVLPDSIQTKKPSILHILQLLISSIEHFSMSRYYTIYELSNFYIIKLITIHATIWFEVYTILL